MSMGKSKVRVFERLKVGVFSTGDEVRNPSSSVPDGCIFDQIDLVIIGLLKKFDAGYRHWNFTGQSRNNCRCT